MGKLGEKEALSLWTEYTPRRYPDEKAHLNVATMQVDVDRPYRELAF